MCKKSGSGYGIQIRDERPESCNRELGNNFGVELIEFFDADPGSGMEKIRIRDPGQTSLICDNTFSDPGSGMEENPDPGKTSRIRNNELHIYGFKKKMLTHRSPKRFRPLTSWNSRYCSSRAQTASSTPEKKKWNLH
jgi:hypothetical protein